MASRSSRVGGDYPHLPALERSLERRATLTGALKFLQSEGFFVLASDKVGAARAGGRIWLRPSAYRRMGNYLDMKPQSVAGYRLFPSPFGQMTLSSTPLYDQFVAAAEELRGQTVESQREIRLLGNGADEAGIGWTWSGLIAYCSVFDLVGGERIKSEAHIPVYARNDDGGVEIAAVLRKPQDLSVVERWLHAGCEPSRRGWHAVPISLPHDEPERSAAIKTLLQAIGGSDLLAVNHPDVFRDGTLANDDDDDFVDVLQRSLYVIDMTTVDVVLARARRDGGVIAGLNTYAHDSAQSAVVSVRMKQRPDDAHLLLAWQPGRQLKDGRTKPTLTTRLWTNLPPLDWDEQKKRHALLAAWERITKALADEERAAALRATA